MHFDDKTFHLAQAYTDPLSTNSVRTHPAYSSIGSNALLQYIYMNRSWPVSLFPTFILISLLFSSLQKRSDHGEESLRAHPQVSHHLAHSQVRSLPADLPQHLFLLPSITLQSPHQLHFFGEFFSDFFLFFFLFHLSLTLT